MSGWRCLQVAVTSGPRATTWPMPLGDKPSHGARELTNKVRQRPLRRPHASRRRSPHPRRPVAAEIMAVALAGHHQLSGAPVDVVDRQGRHLATARPQPRQHRQDRDVAASGAAPPITTLQHRATSSTATARTTPRYANPKRVWRWGCVAGRRRHLRRHPHPAGRQRCRHHPQTHQLIDAAAGRPVSPNLAQRMITISFEQLQAIPGVVAMSHSIVRLAATRTILRSGVVDYLVIDDELAHALLVDSPMLVETTGSPRSVDPDTR